MSFKNFCYNHFGSIGERLASTFTWLDRWLYLSGLDMHPSVYASIIVFISLLMIIPASLAALLILTVSLQLNLPQPLFILLYKLSFLPTPLIILLLTSPLLSILIGIFIPLLIAKNKLYNFELELPYVASYLAVMVSSGLPLYEGLRRIGRSRIFKNTSRYISKLEVATLTKSMAPIYVMEKFANALNVKGFKEFVLGYTSTLRSGGDVADYVYRKAELLFQQMLSRVKSAADKLSLIMEAYIAVVCLGGIGLYLLFVISMPMSDVLGLTQLRDALAQEPFFVFSFLVIPTINVIFIYLADSSQLSYPERTIHRYTPYLAALPAIGFMIAGTVVPYILGIEPLPQLQPLATWVKNLTKHQIGNEGFTPAILLCIILITATIPAAIYDILESRKEAAYSSGLTNFLRDLVETRKSGLPPEKCLVYLSRRNYGRFNKILDRIRKGIEWGLPLRKIYEEVTENLDSWLISANLFFLIDTIEVGGGAAETLEAMARFSENSILIEKERKALLRPLIFIPYLGAILLILVSLSFLSFMNDMLSIAGSSLPMVTFVKLLMTPIPLQMYLLGLTAGKISSGRVSGGFIHAILLTIVTLLAIIFSPMIDVSSLVKVG